MRHIILFSYIFTIPIIVASLVIYLMKRREYKDKTFDLLGAFITTVLVSSILDMFTYFGDDYMKLYLGRAVWLVTYLLYIGVAFAWLQIGCNRVKTEAGKILTKLGRYYIVAYVCTLTVVYLSNVENLKYVDYLSYFMIVLLVANGILVIEQAIRNKKMNLLVLFSIVGTLLVGGNCALVNLDTITKYQIFGLSVTIWMAMGILLLITLILELYLSKNEDERYFNTEIIDKVLELIKEENTLTNREFEILKEVYQGNSNGQIAEKLCISDSTAKTHVHNLLKKLELGSRLEVVLMVQNKVNEFTKSPN